MPAANDPLGSVPTAGGGRKLNARVAQEIGARILQGTYPPGSILPNEAEWSRMFGVSRTAVREAIKTLSGKGLLVSQARIGSRVEPRNRWNLLDRDVLAWLSAATDERAFFASTQEVRQLLEVGVAGLAAAKRSQGQLDDLMDALEGMRRATSVDELIEPDVRFHLALLAATNNDFLTPLGVVIEHALTNLFRYTSRNNPRPDIVIPLHEAVAFAVAHGDPREARLAMSRLLDDTDAVIAHGGRPAAETAPSRLPPA